MASDRTQLRSRFREVIATEAELRAVLGYPGDKATAKVVRTIDEYSRRFIAASPFLLIGTAGHGGMIDVSPKGDPAGFVKVLDETTLAIPDRLGNARLDTFRNILANPNVGLIFLIPNVTYTLRVSGKAVIVRDPDLRQSMAINGKPPAHVIVVDVEHVLTHCPKCMVRSGFWQPDKWPDVTDVPPFAETLAAHAKLADSLEDLSELLDRDTREKLY
ncbi:MAG: MSMEG_1061 family FMN-dependent PPOX-type flavoprotein [Bauldia sp.]